jgi:hypothetical protein
MEKNKVDVIMNLYDGQKLVWTLYMECARELVIRLLVQLVMWTLY